MAQCARPVPHGAARGDLALSTGGKSHGGRVPCGAVEDRRVETVALARARAVPSDKPLDTCDNDEKETTTTFAVARDWHPSVARDILSLTNTQHILIHCARYALFIMPFI